MASISEEEASTVEKSKPTHTADRIMITDPLCCWSLALDSHWAKLRKEYRDRIEWDCWIKKLRERKRPVVNNGSIK